jgi:hypothetical protein
VNFVKVPFTDKYILATHQEKAKYCLEIQGKQEIELFICEYCGKDFLSKNKLLSHLFRCEIYVNLKHEENFDRKIDKITEKHKLQLNKKKYDKKSYSKWQEQGFYHPKARN